MSKELEYFQEIIKVDKEALTLANKEKSKKRDVMLHRRWLNQRKNSIEQALKEHEQYKAIEQELGIDLLNFSKILYALEKECVYVKVKEKKQYDGYSVDEETGEIERKVIVRFSRYINGTRDWFFTISFSDISSVNQYLLKDYGKTWALTRKELEK